MEPDTSRRIRLAGPRSMLGFVIAASSVVLLVGWCAWLVWDVLTPEILREVSRRHFLLLIGMPVCCMCSFIVLGVFRATAGPLQFKALGFEFNGASGPVVLWVVVFLSCVGGMVALWAPAA